MHNTPHRRYDPLRGAWVLVSPQRTARPWRGAFEKPAASSLPAYDPDCYLCPGNRRAGLAVNPPYTGVYVFDNDFPALLPPNSLLRDESDAPRSLFTRSNVSGVCRVVCISPRHDLTLPQLSQAEVEAVVAAWVEQSRLLSELDFIKYVQVFENKGEMMGCSNPHPHSQIWATSFIPDEPQRELENLLKYREETAACLLCDLLTAETHSAERLVAVNDLFSAWVPFWAVWPFELLVVSRLHLASLFDLDGLAKAALADILRQVTGCYDRLFGVSFPYSMGFHQSPADGRPHPECHLHLHFYPPLLRSATVRKFMVGFEMLAMPQRDMTPELAAQWLREK